MKNFKDVVNNFNDTISRIEKHFGKELKDVTIDEVREYCFSNTCATCKLYNPTYCSILPLI